MQFNSCENRSVFSKEELEKFWTNKRDSLLVVKFIVVGALSKKVTLKYLWENDIVAYPNGPRSFDSLSDAQFESILKQSSTDFYLARD